jgi:hypothetical protein
MSMSLLSKIYLLESCSSSMIKDPIHTLGVFFRKCTSLRKRDGRKEEPARNEKTVPSMSTIQAHPHPGIGRDIQRASALVQDGESDHCIPGVRSRNKSSDVLTFRPTLTQKERQSMVVKEHAKRRKGRKYEGQILNNMAQSMQSAAAGLLYKHTVYMGFLSRAGRSNFRDFLGNEGVRIMPEGAPQSEMKEDILERQRDQAENDSC